MCLKTLEFIDKNSKQTGNKSGISLPQLKQLTGISGQELKDQFNTLSREGKIHFREGINQKLFFIYDKN